MLKKLLRFNWIMFASMVALAFIGVVFIRSAGAARTIASLQDAWRVHAATALFGLILYFVLAFIDYRIPLPVPPAMPMKIVFMSRALPNGLYRTL